MRDPVTAADGETYDRASLRRAVKERRTSPTTGMRLGMNGAVSNVALLATIRAWLNEFSFPVRVLLLTGECVVVPVWLTDDLSGLVEKIGSALSVPPAELRLFRGCHSLRGSGTLEDLQFHSNEAIVNGVLPFPMPEYKHDPAELIARCFSELIIDPKTFRLGAQVYKDSKVTVYAAKDPNGQGVMVKQFPNMFDPTVRQCFLRDAFVPQLFKYPGIVTVLGFAFPADPARPGIVVTEDLPNGRLDCAVATRLEGRFSPVRRSKVLFGIATALNVIHAAGAILGNLRPWNIMLDAQYEPRIFSFQDVHFGHELPAISRSAGPAFPDILFISPEGIDHASCSRAIDVYALGSLICSGFGPMTKLDDGWTIRPNIALLMRKLGSEGRLPMKPQAMSAAFTELVENCWTRAPEDRPMLEDIVMVMMLSPKELSVAGTDVNEYSAYCLKRVSLRATAASRLHGRTVKFIKTL